MIPLPLDRARGLAARRLTPLAAGALLALAAACATPAPKPTPTPGPPPPNSESMPTRAAVATPVATPAPVAAPVAPASVPGQTIYQRVGEPALNDVVVDFRKRIKADPRIGARFENANGSRVGPMLTSMILAMAGGPKPYEGRDMRTVHMGMDLTPAEFDAFMELWKRTLADHKMPQDVADFFVGKFEAMRGEIVMSAADKRAMFLETRLNVLDQRITALTQKIDELSAGKGSAPKAADAAKPKASKPKGKSADVTHPQAWNKQEKEETAPKLVKAYTEAKAKPASDQGIGLVGHPLKQTRFLDADGQLVDLADYAGKKRVALFVMRGFSGGQVCLNCSTQALALGDSIQKFRDRGVEVVLIYPGEASTVPGFVEAMRNLRENFEPPYSILLDVDLSAVRIYQLEGSLAKPTTLLVDQKGDVFWAYVGKQAADRPSVAQILDELDKQAQAKN